MHRHRGQTERSPQTPPRLPHATRSLSSQLRRTPPMGRFLRQALRLLSSEAALRLRCKRSVYFSSLEAFICRTSNLKLFLLFRASLIGVADLAQPSSIGVADL